MLPIKFEDFNGPDWTVPHNGRQVSQIGTSIRNCEPGSNTNSPCVSLPARRPEEGLPVNMELFALTGDDRRLLAVARRVEDFITN